MYVYLISDLFNYVVIVHICDINGDTNLETKRFLIISFSIFSHKKIIA
jgi:hypothetical protein